MQQYLDLFEGGNSNEKFPDKILLPDLVFGPVKFSIGIAKQLIRSSQEIGVENVYRIKTGQRSFEKCYFLENNEKIIVTKRKKLALPENIDGILFENEDNSYYWLDHVMLREKQGLHEQKGMKTISKKAGSTWKSSFQFNSEELDKDGVLIPGKEGLRPPQLGALFAIGAHWSIHNNPATIIIPTGVGKTESMLSTLAAYNCAPLLVATPTVPLRDQTANKFFRFGLLRKLKLLKESDENPIVGIVEGRPKTIDDLRIFEECNVIVGTMSSLSGGTAAGFVNEIAKRCDTLILDEAHHVTAFTWMKLRNSFNKNRVLQFTATPFRRDEALVDGSIIYSYPLKSAQADGYFKPITFHPVHELTTSNADIEIATQAVTQLKKDLDSYNHLVMARCNEISRAEEVLKIYEKIAPEYNPVLVNSEVEENSDELIDGIRTGKSKIVICVNMLGEGFDLPELKIAAIHDSHKSLAVLLQFVGRFTRSTGKNLGNATAIANIANLNVSEALEKLYSEDSDWNYVLSELSSNAAKEHAELIDFLNSSKPLMGEETENEISISQHLLRPALSTLFFRAISFKPKKFFEELPSSFRVVKVWNNEESNTLFFVTKSAVKVKWSQSKELIETGWDLFVLHFNAKQKLLYLGSTDKSTSFVKMVRSVGGISQIEGEQIFRCLGNIGRLVFQNIGVTKHGRRNLSYAMYTGSDVRQALSLSEKSGSRKSNLKGSGWDRGKQVNIGCSYKGRVWALDKGTVPNFIKWCEYQGDKLIDDTIDTKKIIDNVLIPDEVFELPKQNVLGIEWPIELFRYQEERLSFKKTNNDELEFFMFDLEIVQVDHGNNEIKFAIVDVKGNIWNEYILKIGGTSGFSVKSINKNDLTISFGRTSENLSTFFSNYPPLIRYVDLSELDGNLILKPQNPEELELDKNLIEVWSWKNVDIKKESIWKDGVERKDSVQWKVAQKFIGADFDIVFDDDGSGEAADLVCFKEEKNHIRLVLIHCKYSDSEKSGVRIKDVVEVASQAVRSTKWPGRFRELCSHLLNRNEKRKSADRPTFLMKGKLSDITKMSRIARFKEIRTEIVIVQPGVRKSKLSPDQSQVLASASVYIKETVNIDLDIICSS